MNARGLVRRAGLPVVALGLIAATLASLGHAADPARSQAPALIADRVAVGWSLDAAPEAVPGSLAASLQKMRDGGRITVGFHLAAIRRPPPGANWTICDRLAFERRWDTGDPSFTRNAAACSSRLFASASPTATVPRTE